MLRVARARVVPFSAIGAPKASEAPQLSTHGEPRFSTAKLTLFATFAPGGNAILNHALEPEIFSVFV